MSIVKAPERETRMPMLDEVNDRPPRSVLVNEKSGKTVPRPVPSLLMRQIRLSRGASERTKQSRQSCLRRSRPEIVLQLR